MVRYFSYIDVPTIESCYNQLENSYLSKKVNNTKSNEIEGEVTISLLNVIRGFFTGEGSLRATRNTLSSEELELTNSIEVKIQRLLECISDSEKNKISIYNFDENRKLVCGTIKVMEQEMFINAVSKYYNKKIDTYNDFLDEFMRRKKVFNKWGEVEQLIDNYNGVDILDIMNSWCFDKEKMITFIIVDNKYPIRMELSSKKITMPHSDLTSSGLFARTTKFHILGITNNISGIFTIKPLALWNIITKDECRKFVYDKRFW